MEKIKITVSDKISSKYMADLCVVPCLQKKNGRADCAKFENENLKKCLKTGDFKATEKEVFVDYSEDAAKKFQAKRVLFVGLGRSGKLTDEKKDVFREIGGAILQFSRKVKAATICLRVSDLEKKGLSDIVPYLIEGMFLADYAFEKYKKVEDDKKYQGMGELRLLTGQKPGALRKKIENIQMVAESVKQARDMANEPGSNWTPDSFAEYAKNLSDDDVVTCTVLEKKQLQSLGMGGILAVNRGSGIAPKLVIVEYTASAKAKTVLLVGKGLTFDSGGISLKPATGMEEMKYDMCGGAAVLATMNWVKKSKPACNVVALVPTTDNMPGKNALKPGDIIRHYNGSTSEIVNTDAEGRLILGDALCYGVEKYSPDYVIDLATLTGAVIIALGHHNTGLFTNNESLFQMISEAGSEVGEPVWRLPLGKQYAKQIESKIADIKNTGGRDAGAVTAAQYLAHFIGEIPWAHMDIAGTAWNFTEKTYVPSAGASGGGVRTLIEFIKRQ